MNTLEKEIEYLLDKKQAIEFPTKTNKIEFKADVCRKILKHLTKKDDVEVIIHESKKCGEGSSAQGSILLKNNNVKITIVITTHCDKDKDKKYIVPCISVRAKYLGDEEGEEGEEGIGELLFSVGGELAESIMIYNQFGYFEEFVRVKTVEFIYKLNQKYDEKLTSNINLYKNIFI